MLAMMMMMIACELPIEGQSCNLMYAPNMLNVEVSADWSGDVRIDVTGDGETISCTLIAEEAAAQCDDLGSLIERAGEQVVVSLWDYTPDVVDVTVEHAGGGGSVVLEPSYTIDEPNGPGCGERRLATEQVSL